MKNFNPFPAKCSLVALSMAIVPSMVYAKTISPEEALNRSQTESSGVALKARAANKQFVYSKTISLETKPCVYLFEDDSQQIMALSADDRTQPILAFYNNQPAGENPTSNYWLDFYAQEIASLNSYNATEKTISQSTNIQTNRTDIAPLINTKWGQAAPYNDKCYHYYTQQKCYSGCVTTAVAQIMNYWHWPEEHAHGEFGDRYNKYRTNFENGSFDWDNLLPSYDGAVSETEKEAVADLMYYTAIALAVEFGTEATCANSLAAPFALFETFGYDPNMTWHLRSLYSLEDWSQLIYSELENNRPILFFGSNVNMGHAFICDGYKTMNGEDYFHFNMGWSGASDGYYLLSATNNNACLDDKFPIWQNIYTGIQPNYADWSITPELANIKAESTEIIMSDSAIEIPHAVLIAQREWCEASLVAYMGVDFTDCNEEIITSLYSEEGVKGLDWNRYSTYGSKNNNPWRNLSTRISLENVPDNVESGTYYLKPFYEIRDLDDNVIVKDYFKLSSGKIPPTISCVKPNISGISEVSSDSNADVVYYTLSGIRLDHRPSIAGVYVAVSNTSSKKIYIR